MRTDPDDRVIAYVDQETDRREAESQEYLREVEARLDGVAVELRVQFGDPAHEIALEAEAFGADLIAMVTPKPRWRSEEHTSELQSQSNLVCRLLLEKKKNRHARALCIYC